MYKPVPVLMQAIAKELIKDTTPTTGWYADYIDELDQDQFIVLVEALVLSATHKVLKDGILNWDKILPTQDKTSCTGPSI